MNLDYRPVKPGDKRAAEADAAVMLYEDGHHALMRVVAHTGHTKAFSRADLGRTVVSGPALADEIVLGSRVIPAATTSDGAYRFT